MIDHFIRLQVRDLSFSMRLRLRLLFLYLMGLHTFCAAQITLAPTTTANRLATMSCVVTLNKIPQIKPVIGANIFFIISCLLRSDRAVR